MLFRSCVLPPGRPQVLDLHVEEGQERSPTEGAGAIEVGVVRRPAGHDLLIVHQAVTRLAAGAARHQHLTRHKETSVPGTRARSLHISEALSFVHILATDSPPLCDWD